MGTKIKHVHLSACLDIITVGDYERPICLHLFYRSRIRMQSHYSAWKQGQRSARERDAANGAAPSATTHGERAACKRTQLFLIGNSAPMADLHSGACASLNPWPCQTQPWGEGRGNGREKQEGGEAGVKRGNSVAGERKKKRKKDRKNERKQAC